MINSKPHVQIIDNTEKENKENKSEEIWAIKKIQNNFIGLK